jgi:hypothetical protein
MAVKYQTLCQLVTHNAETSLVHSNAPFFPLQRADYLDTDLLQQADLPAIDVGKSVSRVGSAAKNLQ